MTMVARDPEAVAVDTLRRVSQGHVMEVINRLVVERLHVLLRSLERGTKLSPALRNLLSGIPADERDFFLTRIEALTDQLVERDFYALIYGKLPRWTGAAGRPSPRRTEFYSLADWRSYHVPLDPDAAEYAERYVSRPDKSEEDMETDKLLAYVADNLNELEGDRP